MESPDLPTGAVENGIEQLCSDGGKDIYDGGYLQGIRKSSFRAGVRPNQLVNHPRPANYVPWEGKILSLTGKTPNFPTLEEARAAGLFHPNCRHAYGLHIDLDKETKKAETYAKGKEKREAAEKKLTVPPTVAKESALTPEQKLEKERGLAIEYLKNITPETQGKHIEAIEDIVKKQTPEVQEYFCKYIGALSKISDTSSGGCYRPLWREIDIPFNALENDKSGPYTVFFHEFGHFVDHVLSISNKAAPHMLFSAQDRKFYDLIKKEYYKLLNPRALEAERAGTPGVRVGLKPEIWQALYLDNSTSGVQDTINGTSILEGHGIRVLWGHSNDYWRSFESVNKETFASMFASFFNPDMAKAYEKYLPDSYTIFKEKLIGDVGELVTNSGC